MQTMWINLLSGFIGAVLGGIIVLIATIIQNKYSSKLQKYAFVKQNETLEKTFENGIKLHVLQLTMQEELNFLNKLHNSLNQSGKSTLLNPKKYCIEYDTLIRAYGKDNFISILTVSKNAIFEVLNSFIKLVEDFSFLGKKIARYEDEISFKEELEDVFENLIKDVQAISDPHNNDELITLKKNIPPLKNILATYEKWIEGNVEAIKNQKTKLLHRNS